MVIPQALSEASSVRIQNFIGIRPIERAVGLSQCTLHESGTDGQTDESQHYILRGTEDNNKNTRQLTRHFGRCTSTGIIISGLRSTNTLMSLLRF